MSRIEAAETRTLLPLRARVVPIATTMAASALAVLPFVSDTPLLPPFGLLMLLAWRLLRPEMWQAWIGLPLGLFDDLMSGQPLGSAMAVWTMALLALDLSDNRAVWHDYWHDLLVAALILTFCIAAGWLAAAIVAPVAGLQTMVPQLLLSILLMPMAMRIAARLDRFRLAR
ncbi:MAG TPA: rod shape-determining protein MreD [Sphingomonadaceae bacterium]|nr:rod shape-determining protein MreD [Sphingomonadaceae bacterium]